jgi:ABC-type transport system substrate-binding protein
VRVPDFAQGKGVDVRKARQILGVFVILCVASAVGCDFLSTEADTGEQKQQGKQGGVSAGGSAQKGKEAPELAELVEAGDLPAVEERLPEKPMVVEPIDQIGQYGGTWNSAILGSADVVWLWRTVGYEPLVRWDPEWTEPIPNVAKSVEVAGSGREYTFKLREGMKWSDGKPFTADDIVFAYEDVLLNEDLTPEVPITFVGGDEPAKIEKVDDYTVKFTFPDEPNGLFLEQLSYNGLITSWPRHYLEQFHEKYNPDVEQLAEEEDAADWISLFTAKAGVAGLVDPAHYQNQELPTLAAWKVEQPLGEGGRVVVERNPYYWKVDPDGSQLPYIDSVIYDVIPENEAILQRTLEGSIDMHIRHFNTFTNKPVLAQNRDSGGYDFFDAEAASMNTMIIALNLTHEDPVKREIFNNKDFRIGLSYALNRQEIIDVVFQEQGEPFQAAPRPNSPFYNEELAKQYTEYSVEKANQALDRAGYTQRNEDGIRLGPDGNPISFTIEFATEFQPTWPDALELVQDYWQKVGVDVQIKPEDRVIFYERKEANQPDATVWVGDGGGKDVTIEARWYFPFSLESNHAIPWAEWYISRGQSGQEPPEAAKRQMELYDELHATINEDEQAKIMAEILDIAQEEFYVIGTSLPPESYGVVKNNFHNVPEMYDAALYPQPGPTNPEQYFITGE